MTTSLSNSPFASPSHLLDDGDRQFLIVAGLAAAIAPYGGRSIPGLLDGYVVDRQLNGAEGDER